MILALAFLSLNAFAQDQKDDAPRHDRGPKERPMHDFTPEQMATLQTKKMTLALDLSDAQQKDIYNLNLNQAKARKTQRETFKANKEKGVKLTENDKYDHMIARLDAQIAYKSKMKSILKSDQYSAWVENMANKRHEAKDRMNNRKDRRHFQQDPNQEPRTHRRS